LLVHVNGEDKEIVEGTLLAELITQLNLPVQRIAVELNRSVVRRPEWEKTVLREGDRVEIVHFVGGGCEVASMCE
jgi:thiamine biosynthesis protein ThiS